MKTLMRGAKYMHRKSGTVVTIRKTNVRSSNVDIEDGLGFWVTMNRKDFEKFYVEKWEREI